MDKSFAEEMKKRIEKDLQDKELAMSSTGRKRRKRL